MLQLETAKGKEKEHAILDGYGGGGAGKRVDPMPTAVWAAVMDTSKGRDKVLVSAAFHGTAASGSVTFEAMMLSVRGERDKCTKGRTQRDQRH